MDTPVEGETGDEAEAEIERLEKELEELEAIIGELKDKVREGRRGLFQVHCDHRLPDRLRKSR
jgi:predicted RNase H-like nuclease (RuvC/YqgF family)